MIDGFADTRKDPIKRKKIYRVLDFVETNKDAYKRYLNLDKSDSQTRLELMTQTSQK